MHTRDPDLYAVAQALVDPTPTVDASILRTALQHRVGYVLLNRLPPDAPVRQSALWQRAMRRAHRAVAQSMGLMYALRRIEATLATSQLNVMWLKGAVLAQTVYAQSGQRPMVDLDLLIHPEQHAVITETLTTLGYQRPEMPDNLFKAEDAITEADHHTTLHGGVADRTSVEVHIDLVREGYLTAAMRDWLWDHTMPVVVDDLTFTAPVPEAHLIYLCAHAIMQHTEREFMLLRFYDMHQVITHYTLDWDLVAEGASLLKWTYATERALTITQQYFHTPIPARVFAHLQHLRPADEDVAAIRKMQTAGGTWVTIQQRLKSATLRQRLIFLQRTAFPPVEYMRRRYGVPEADAIWPYYVKRWWHQGREVIRSLLPDGQSET